MGEVAAIELGRWCSTVSPLLMSVTPLPMSATTLWMSPTVAVWRKERFRMQPGSLAVRSAVDGEGCWSLNHVYVVKIDRGSLTAEATCYFRR